MAYRQEAPETVATYESCSTSAFKHGRTETMRPVTMKTKAFVDNFYGGKKSKEEMKQLLHECSDLHFQLVKEASMGKGCDRHLFALKNVAERWGEKVPELFEDEAYGIANNFILSTSTLSTDTVILGGFGPVVKDGYGIGYTVGSKRMGCCVTGYRASGRTPVKFTDAVHESLDGIRKLIDS